ncbi:MAG: MFS transporter [Salinibacterium sp.]|nr:MFS transporter [Salinibacterium sp.]
MSTSEQPFRWGSIALPALLPTLMFSIGEGAIIPIIPIAANNLGASLAIAGLVAGILTIGELFGNIPSGWLIARVGERPAMIGASGLSVVGLVICVIAPNPIALGFGVLLIGLATAVFALARHAFMTSFVPIEYRARALSTLGGTFRLGYFIGPFLTAAVIQLTGIASSAFWIHIVLCLSAAVILITLPDPTATFGVVRTVRLAGREMREGEALVEQESVGLFNTLYRSRAVLSRLGLGAALIGALRASRQVVLPLWAVSIGISEPNTAVIIGIAGGVDFALFYASGQIMDRFGRLWSALPSMIGLGIGHLVLSFTHDLDSNVSWFIGAAMFLSLANGIGSGILMTLGADLADPRNPAPFLGAWRFTGNLGGAGAPLVISGVTAAASLSIAVATLGVLGLLGAGVIARYLPRFSPRTPPAPGPDVTP